MIGKPVVGVEDLVADKVVEFAMERIGAGLRDHIDDGATGKTIFRAEVRLLDLEFRDRFDRGRIGDIGDAAVRFHIGDGSAIQQDVGSGIAAAIGNEVGTGAVDAAGVIHGGDSWRQLDQVQHIAVV